MYLLGSMTLILVVKVLEVPAAEDAIQEKVEVSFNELMTNCSTVTSFSPVVSSESLLMVIP